MNDWQVAGCLYLMFSLGVAFDEAASSAKGQRLDGFCNGLTYGLGFPIYLATNLFLVLPRLLVRNIINRLRGNR